MEARDIRNLQRAYLDVYGEAFVDPETGDLVEEDILDEGLGSALRRVFSGKKKEVEAPKPESRGAELRRRYNVGPERSDTSAKRQILDRSRARAERDQKEYGDSKYSSSVAQKSKDQHDRYLRAGYSKYGADDANAKGRGRGNKARKRAAELQKEEYDLYDIILSHLLDEGYAEDVQSAEVIMVNMSEDWREDILDEVYDADVMGRSQISKRREGGRIGAERKKSAAERRRVKAVGGGRTEPVEYKPRKDIGSQRQTSARVQQPTQERGSADVKARAAAAAREERRKAAIARAAAAKRGASDTQAKPKAKEVSKQATQLLSTKKEKKPVSPDYTPAKASGYTTKERMSITRAGEKKLRGIMKTQEVEKYRDITGENPTGKALTKVLARVHKRMST